MGTERKEEVSNIRQHGRTYEADHNAVSHLWQSLNHRLGQHLL